MDTTGIIEALAWIPQIAGFVWAVLTLLLIVALRLLARREGRLWNRYSKPVFALLAMIWLYPVFTVGFQLLPGLVGNVAVALLAIYAMTVARPRSTTAGYLIAPVVVWLSAATFYVALLIIRP